MDSVTISAEQAEREVSLEQGSGKRHNLLLVAYHFPPCSGSSGHLRPLKFCKYLLDCNWHTTVLTAHPGAYEQTDPGQLAEIPREIDVTRAFALDARRHLSWRGRYPGFLAMPDRYAGWCLAALPAGLRAIYKNDVEVILTTFPVATAVLLGFLLHRLTGLPWVLDLRDVMTEDDYPAEPRIWRAWRWLERQAIEHASLLVFTADSARAMYLERYPRLDAAKCVVIRNGYDEVDFEGLAPAGAQAGRDRPCRMVHPGIIYPSERDPRPLFRALAALKSQAQLSSADLILELRGSGHDAELSVMLEELNIDDIVRLQPPLPYREALQDALAADAMLLLQAGNCNRQVPAKVYEYLRLGHPILALTDPRGETANLLRQSAGATIVDIANEQAISAAVSSFLESIRAGTHARPDKATAESYSRKQQSYALARCLTALLPTNGR